VEPYLQPTFVSAYWLFPPYSNDLKTHFLWHDAFILSACSILKKKENKIVWSRRTSNQGLVILSTGTKER
jgi:hypothetical protein